jgi:hypothetical protein
MKIVRTSLLLASMLLAACGSNVRPDRTQNPPPSEPLANFQHFELAPLKTAPDAGENVEAVKSIDTHLKEKLGPLATSWSSSTPGGRTLRIEPTIEQMKFVSVTSHIFAGPFAGSSGVVMNIRLVDADTGKLVAEPQFYQRTPGIAGAYGADYGMLVRIATVAEQYMQRNRQAAVGGPTGLDGTED